MKNINNVVISGNLTRDPEVHSLPAGGSVLSISIASNESRKGPDGQYHDTPNYIDCVLFGSSRVAGVAPLLFKGAHVVVSGSLRYSAWERDGQKRSKVEVVVNDIEIASPARRKTADAPINEQPAAPWKDAPDYYA